MLDLEQVAGELEELFALGRLLGVRMEGALATVAQVRATLALDGGINGCKDHSAGSSLRGLEEELLEEWHRSCGRVLEQISVHNARMDNVHLNVCLLRIQHSLQMAGEQNLGKLRLAVGGSRVIVFPKVITF